MFDSAFSICISFYIVYFLIEAYHQFNSHQLWKPSFYRDELLYFEGRPKVKHYTDYGYKIAPHKRIVIVGLCRDADKYIGKNLQIFSKIGSYFKDYRIIVYENDSKDNTRKILDKHAKNDSRIIVLGENCNMKNVYHIGAFHNDRFEKMVEFRNYCLAYVRNNFADYDYMMVVDWDMNGSTDMNGIMNSIGRDYDEKTEWSAIGTSGNICVYGTFGLLLLNYDTLALRFHNIKYDQNHLKSVFFNHIYQEYHKLLYPDLEPVHSTFHGIVIYKMAAIPPDAWYNTEFGCEHIGFHDKIKNMYINRNWVSYFGTQGPNWLSFIGKSILKLFV